MIFKGKRQSRLENLKCFPNIRHMIGNSVKVSDIAKFIQEEKEYTDISHKSLCDRLRKYIVDNGKEFVGDQVPMAHNAMLSTAEGFDPLQALYSQFHHEMDRLLKAFQFESQIKKTLTFNNSIVSGLLQIIKDIARLQQSNLSAKMRRESNQDNEESDCRKKAEAIVLERAAKKWGEDTARVIGNSTSRHRVLSALDKLLHQDSHSTSSVLVQPETATIQ